MQQSFPMLPRSEQQVAQWEGVTEEAVFRRVLARVHPSSIDQMDERHERQVYLLTNGTRSLGRIASLLGISPIEVAYWMKQLLQRGYVEYVQEM